MSRGKTFAGLATIAMFLLAGFWWGRDAATPAMDVAIAPAEGPVHSTPAKRLETSAKPAESDVPKASSQASPRPLEEAIVAHSERAAPQWRRASEVLIHADPPVYADIALALAGRLDSAAAAGIEPPLLQELIVEERQLVDHLKRRYEGIPELQRQLASIEDSIVELEDTLSNIGPSPDPRD